MNRTLANVIADLAAVFLFVGMIATGYILRFPLPPGTNRVLTLWGFSRHQWGSVHFWISLGLLVVIAIHLVLHWKWVVTVVGKRLRLVKTAHPSMLRSGILVTGIFVVAFGAFAFAAHWGVKEMSSPLHELDAANENNLGEISSPETQTTRSISEVDFWNDVYPLFERHCVSCHGPARKLADLRVDQPADLFGEGGKIAQIVPGKSASSPLIAIVTGERTGMRMLDQHKLSEQDVSLLRAWIDAGASWPEKQDQNSQ